MTHLSWYGYTNLKKALTKCKANKTVGTDCIPNEILKTNNVTIDLQKLTNKCFHCNMVSSVWLQAIVFPTPKSKENDVRVPLITTGILAYYPHYLRFVLVYSIQEYRNISKIRFN